MSPEPNETNSSQEKKTEKKKKGKMNPVLLYGIGFLASFGVVFASTFFYVTKVQQPKMAEAYAVQLATEQADSLQSSIKHMQTDSTGQIIADVDTTISDAERKEKEYRELERMRLVEQVSILRDRLEQSQMALNELKGVAQMTDSLFNEHNQLKKEYEEADEELKFLKETLPGNMDKLMETIQEAANNSGANAETMAQQPVVAQQQLQTDENDGKGLRKLAKIYGNMKPKDASAIMENMSDGEVVDIMIRMRDRDAAAILTAFTDKARAATISRKMQSQ